MNEYNQDILVKINPLEVHFIESILKFFHSFVEKLQQLMVY